MRICSVMGLAVAGALTLSDTARAEKMISPYSVLAEKRAQDYDERAARITSIMVMDERHANPLKIPKKPRWKVAVRRHAEARVGSR